MIAVDTNVLIYACDQAEPRKQEVALDLLANATDGVLLWQVACEFLSASRKLNKQGFTAAHAWKRLSEFRDLLRLVLPNGRQSDPRSGTARCPWDAALGRPDSRGVC